MSGICLLEACFSKEADHSAGASQARLSRDIGHMNLIETADMLEPSPKPNRKFVLYLTAPVHYAESCWHEKILPWVNLMDPLLP